MNTSSPMGRLPTIVLLLIVTLGIPGAAALAFSEQITQHPWYALGVAPIYEVLVLIGGTVSQVWQKLQSRWVDRATDHVDAFLQGLAPGYHKRYLEHLRYAIATLM